MLENLFCIFASWIMNHDEDNNNKLTEPEFSAAYINPYFFVLFSRLSRETQQSPKIGRKIPYPYLLLLSRRWERDMSRSTLSSSSLPKMRARISVTHQTEQDCIWDLWEIKLCIQ